jgi:hypothetical protein
MNDTRSVLSGDSVSSISTIALAGYDRASSPSNCRVYEDSMKTDEDRKGTNQVASEEA